MFLWWSGLDCKESTCNAGDQGSIPGLGRSPGEGNGNPLQCSGLENPMDRGAWRATVDGVTESWQLRNFFFFSERLLFAVFNFELGARYPLQLVFYLPMETEIGVHPPLKLYFKEGSPKWLGAQSRSQSWQKVFYLVSKRMWAHILKRGEST